MGSRDPIYLENLNAEAAADSTVEMASSVNNASLVKVPTRGHYHFTLTSTKSDAGAATVLLKGTNNPDPTSGDGETLITNTHGGSDQEDGSAISKGYKYVFVDVSAGTFAAGSIKLHGTGLG